MKCNSLYAQMDPRSKIIFSIFYISNVLMLQFDNAIQSMLVLVTLTFMIWSSGYSITLFIRKIIRIYPMIFLSTFLSLLNGVCSAKGLIEIFGLSVSKKNSTKIKSLGCLSKSY
jgi:hypothetical protein